VLSFMLDERQETHMFEGQVLHPAALQGVHVPRKLYLPAGHTTTAETVFALSFLVRRVSKAYLSKSVLSANLFNRI